MQIFCAGTDKLASEYSEGGYMCDFTNIHIKLISKWLLDDSLNSANR